MNDLCHSITVIIVSYNSFETLQRCMHDWLSNPSCQIVIVDNASTDDTANQIREHYPQITLLQQEINLGYGRGANRALASVTTPYAILLNPDLYAKEADISKLVDRARELTDNFAILAPAVREKDYLKTGVIARKWVIGAAMLFNMPVLQKIGLFDENIFLFSEETDLCMRAKNENLGIFIDSDVYIQHLLNQSSAPSIEVERLKNWHKGWSRTYYRNKHGLNTGKRANWRVALKYALKSIFSLSKLKRFQNRYRLSGTLAYLKGESAFTADGKPKV